MVSDREVSGEVPLFKSGAVLEISPLRTDRVPAQRIRLSGGITVGLSSWQAFSLQDQKGGLLLGDEFNMVPASVDGPHGPCFLKDQRCFTFTDSYDRSARLDGVKINKINVQSTRPSLLDRARQIPQALQRLIRK